MRLVVELFLVALIENHVKRNVHALGDFLRARHSRLVIRCGTSHLLVLLIPLLQFLDLHLKFLDYLLIVRHLIFMLLQIQNHAILCFIRFVFLVFLIFLLLLIRRFSLLICGHWF